MTLSIDIPTTPEEIAEELAKAAAGKAFDYIGSKALKELIGGTDLSDVARDLETIMNNQQLILGKLDDIMREIKWQSLIVQAAPAMDRIIYCLKRTHEIAQMTDAKERRDAAESLRDVILKDGSDGLRAALLTIHQTLIGHRPLSRDEDGLLVTYVHKLDAKLQTWSHGITVGTHYSSCQNYLAAVLYLQFSGLTMLVSAYRARDGGSDKNKSDLQIQIETLNKNVQTQLETIGKVRSNLWQPLILHKKSTFMFKTREGEYMASTGPLSNEMTYYTFRLIYHHSFNHPGGQVVIRLEPARGEYRAFIEHRAFQFPVSGKGMVFLSEDGKVKSGCDKLSIRPIPYRYPDNRYDALALLTPYGFLRPSKDTYDHQYKLVDFSDRLYAWRVIPHA